MKRTYKCAAVTRDEGNAADGRFPTASIENGDRPMIRPNSKRLTLAHVP
jgi:hypothetical protein